MRLRRAAAALAVVIGAVGAACDGGAERGAGETRARAAATSGWGFAEPMSQRRSYVAAAEVDGRIYVAGGMVGETGRPLALFERFDPEANAWVALPRLPEPVRAGAGASVGDSIYVVGGATPAGPGAQVFAFDLAAGAWRSAASMPEARFNHAALALDGKLYVLGGFLGTEEQDDVFVYDVRADRWSRAAPLPRPNHAFGAVAFDGEIWVVGGRRGEEVLREVWIYDPRADRWRPGPPLPEPMELLGAAASGREIHAVWEATYQVYDFEAGRWRSEPGPAVHRHGLAVFAVEDVLYAVGGCTTELRDTQVVERRSLRRGS